MLLIVELSFDPPYVTNERTGIDVRFESGARMLNGDAVAAWTRPESSPVITFNAKKSQALQSDSTQSAPWYQINVKENGVYRITA